MIIWYYAGDISKSDAAAGILVLERAHALRFREPNLLGPVNQTRMRSDMEHSESKHVRSSSPDVFNYSYVVLAILFLLTIGSTLAYYQNAEMFGADTQARWTPVVFLIGFCISLVIFGMTQREAAARLRLHQKTLDLIAAQKQNEELLRSEQKLRIAAEQANRSKDEFLAVVSHELKTPLNAIAGWNRILKMPGVSDEMRQTAVEKIDKNLRIQTTIVEELLNFSDVMSTDLATTSRSVRIRDVFEDAVATVSVAAFQKGVTLTSDDSLDGERVTGDHARLKTALVNVLSNAVKFTPSGGHVEAHAFASESHVTFIVSDDGLGIAPEFLPHVFERYKQCEGVSTRHYGGLGLGLTIADHIVKLHRGSIEAESSGIGCGSKFTIKLPAA